MYIVGFLFDVACSFYVFQIVLILISHLVLCFCANLFICLGVWLFVRLSSCLCDCLGGGWSICLFVRLSRVL